MKAAGVTSLMLVSIRPVMFGVQAAVIAIPDEFQMTSCKRHRLSRHLVATQGATNLVAKLGVQPHPLQRVELPSVNKLTRIR